MLNSSDTHEKGKAVSFQRADVDQGTGFRTTYRIEWTVRNSVLRPQF